MKSLKTIIALTCLYLSSSMTAFGQEFNNVAGLQEGLASIHSQAIILKNSVMSADAKKLAKPPPEFLNYAVRGIDVSYHQGKINWDKVKGQGLSFVYIKATEGKTGVDPEFSDNWQGADKVGLIKGAYHFYDFCRTGADQADHFIKTVPVTAGALPPMIDLEPSDDCIKMPGKAAFLKDLAAFAAKVKDAYGLPPILYLGDEIYNRYLGGSSDGTRFWVAAYQHTAPKMPDNRSWTFWQYSSKGNISGIDRPVDLDVFDGTAQMLQALSQPPDPAIAPQP